FYQHGGTSIMATSGVEETHKVRERVIESFDDGYSLKKTLSPVIERLDIPSVDKETGAENQRYSDDEAKAGEGKAEAGNVDDQRSEEFFNTVNHPNGESYG